MHGTNFPVDQELQAQDTFSLWGGTIGRLFPFTDEDTGFVRFLNMGWIGKCVVN